MATRITIITTNPLTPSGIYLQNFYRDESKRQAVAFVCAQLGVPMLSAEELEEVIEDHFFEQNMTYQQVKEYVSSLDKATLGSWDIV